MANIKRSPWLLHYDGSSCNGCDIEVLACLTPVYDAERFVIMNTGDPMQADILLITGGINAQNQPTVKQLYEQYGGNPNLDGAFNAADRGQTVFAQVIGGMDVVDKISAVKTDNKNAPSERVEIKSIEITTYQP